MITLHVAYIYPRLTFAGFVQNLVNDELANTEAYVSAAVLLFTNNCCINFILFYSR